MERDEETIRFSGARGGRGGVPRLIVMKGAGIGRCVELSGVELTVGRKDDNGLVLNSLAVSRHHCRFINLATDWFLEDLKSTSGTRLNGFVVPGGERRLVGHGDQITIGDHEVLFVHEQDLTHGGALGGVVLDRTKIDAEVAALLRDLPALLR